MAENEANPNGNVAENNEISANVKQSNKTPSITASKQDGEPIKETESLSEIHRSSASSDFERRRMKQSAEMPLCTTSAVAGAQAQGGTFITDTQLNLQPITLSPAQKRRKPSRTYEQFGETIRYLTWDEWQKLLDDIDDYRHKLMFRLIYHLGCRVGEFVRIQLKHLDFNRNSVFFPAENTKTGHRRTSHVPVGLMNEIKSMLKQEDRMPKRTDTVLNPEDALFRPSGRRGRRYSENRIRQLFQRYVIRAGLNREYGTDSQGRKLHQLTVHSLRHSHIMHHIHIHKLPLPIVQKQVGHRPLKATSVYLNPSEEAVANAYNSVTHEENRRAV